MTSIPELWECIVRCVPHGQWVTLDVIYRTIQNNIELDDEDWEWQMQHTESPRWKHRVRNALLYRKKTGEIEWDKNTSKYRL